MVLAQKCLDLGRHHRANTSSLVISGPIVLSGELVFARLRLPGHRPTIRLADSVTLTTIAIKR